MTFVRAKGLDVTGTLFRHGPCLGKCGSSYSEKRRYEEEYAYSVAHCPLRFDVAPIYFLKGRPGIEH